MKVAIKSTKKCGMNDTKYMTMSMAKIAICFFKERLAKLNPVQTDAVYGEGRDVYLPQKTGCKVTLFALRIVRKLKALKLAKEYNSL